MSKHTPQITSTQWEVVSLLLPSLKTISEKHHSSSIQASCLEAITFIKNKGEAAAITQTTTKESFGITASASKSSITQNITFSENNYKPFFKITVPQENSDIQRLAKAATPFLQAITMQNSFKDISLAEKALAKKAVFEKEIETTNRAVKTGVWNNIFKKDVKDNKDDNKEIYFDDEVDEDDKLDTGVIDKDDGNNYEEVEKEDEDDDYEDEEVDVDYKEDDDEYEDVLSMETGSSSIDKSSNDKMGGDQEKPKGKKETEKVVLLLNRFPLEKTKNQKRIKVIQNLNQQQVNHQQNIAKRKLENLEVVMKNKYQSNLRDLNKKIKFQQNKQKANQKATNKEIQHLMNKIEHTQQKKDFSQGCLKQHQGKPSSKCVRFSEYIDKKY